MEIWSDQGSGRNREENGKAEINAGIERTYNEDNKVISLSHVDENGNPNYETYENVKGKRITLESAYAIIRKNIIRKIR